MAPHSRVGPTEISQSARWGILAGVWLATFLSVRRLKKISSIALAHPPGLTRPSIVTSNTYHNLDRVLNNPTDTLVPTSMH